MEGWMAHEGMNGRLLFFAAFLVDFARGFFRFVLFCFVLFCDWTVVGFKSTGLFFVS